ncbi:hypothetical protein DPMN_140095 [Dreissena polymorpha]|uniref:Uncharacterized protein n=1 Tax=Dreissena polymorpha TaxID=45954 RepID=A0A9D4JK24_DREPO|nr:hypothetical protein DPMN_140095 [Dreissena polymorpha]
MHGITRFANSRKNASPPGGHVFQQTGNNLELIQDIITTNAVTMFYEDWTQNVTSRVFTRTTANPPGGNVFQPLGTIFELVQDIIGTRHLTHLYEDRTIMWPPEC